MRRSANQRFLGAMLDMGIPVEHAELALAETNNVGVEVLGPGTNHSSLLPLQQHSCAPMPWRDVQTLGPEPSACLTVVHK